MQKPIVICQRNERRLCKPGSSVMALLTTSAKLVPSPIPMDVLNVHRSHSLRSRAEYPLHCASRLPIPST